MFGAGPIVLSVLHETRAVTSEMELNVKSLRSMIFLTKPVIIKNYGSGQLAKSGEDQ